MNKKLVIVILVFAIAIAGFFFVKKKRSVVDTAQPEKKSTVEMKPYKTVAVVASYFNDLESTVTGNWLGSQDGEKFYSGAFSNKLNDQNEYGITYTTKVTNIPQYEKIRELKINFQVFSEQHLKKAAFVCAVIGANDTLYSYSQEDIHVDPKRWMNIEISIPLNAALWKNDAVLKIYPWNPGKEIFFLDDVRIDFLSEVERQHEYSFGPLQNFIYDYEPVSNNPQHENLSTDVAHSGKYSMKLSGADSYSESIVKHFSEVAKDTVKFISTSVWIYPKEENPVVTLVVSIEKPDGASIAWNGKATDRIPLKKNEWQKINFRADLRQTNTSPDDIVKIYLWNKNGGTVYADDLEIVYGDIPKPAGFAPGIIMSMFGTQITQTGKNKPPFNPGYFAEADFFSPSSLYLVEGNEKQEGEMNPNDLLLPGFFSGHGDLFIAAEKNWSLYTWCKGKNKFIHSSSASAPFSTADKIPVKGFYNDIRSEEVLFIDTTGKTGSRLLRFNSPGRDMCSISAPVLKQEVTTVSIPAAGKANFIIAGQFQDDKKDELLFFSEDGTWKIFKVINSSFNLKGEGNISRGKILSVHAIETGGPNEKLLVFSERDNKLDYCLVDFSSGTKASIREFQDKSFLDHYHQRASFFSGQFDKHDKGPSIFYFSDEWRFDLKKVSLTDDGLLIDSQIDFIQQDPSKNPRHYEYTKVLQGDFFGDGRDGLLVLMRNCIDPDFDGKRCSGFEEVQAMPSGFSIYQYQKAK